MRPPSSSLPALILAIACAAEAFGAADLAPCLDREEDRLGCVTAVLGDRALNEQDLRALDPLIGRDPAAALALYEGLASRAGGTGDAVPALLDRQAAALAALGRLDAAAERQLRAFEADPGTEWLRWRSGSRAVESRRVEVEPGERLIETAERLVAAGRPGDARPLVDRALRLGARGPAVPLWEAVGGGARAASESEREPLAFGTWYEPLPEVPIRLVGGGTFHPAAARGRVLVLDFWASWCKPCVDELPSLRDLYEAERDRGLEAVIVNVGEGHDVIARFAAVQRLEMPIGLYDEAVDRAYEAAALPTVIVADAQGRIRARFDGYKEGIETTISGIVHSLLAPGAPEPLTEVAEVELGHGLLDLLWMRTAPGVVEGLVVAALDGEHPVAVISGGHEIALYDRRGVVVDYWQRPVGSGELRHVDLDGDGHDELLTFRRGGTRVLQTGPDLEPIGFDAPAPLLDLEALPAPSAGGDAELWMATLERLYRVRPPGSVATPVEGGGTVVAVERVGGRGLAVLASAGVCRVDLAAAALLGCTPRDGAFGLLADGSEVLFELSPGVVAAARGHFTRAAAEEVAVATASGHVVIVDGTTGETVWRAAWPDVSGLAAGDLDGDGLSELVVAAGNRLNLLARRGSATGPTD